MAQSSVRPLVITPLELVAAKVWQDLGAAASEMEAACRDDLDLVTDGYCEICNELLDDGFGHSPTCSYLKLRDAVEAWTHLWRI